MHASAMQVRQNAKRWNRAMLMDLLAGAYEQPADSASPGGEEVPLREEREAPEAPSPLEHVVDQPSGAAPEADQWLFRSHRRHAFESSNRPASLAGRPVSTKALMQLPDTVAGGS